MITFHVSDMTCGHCIGTITRAVTAADPGARVDVALDRKMVRITPVAADADALADAITQAGYTPEPVPAATASAPAGAATPASAAAMASGRCGGGSGCGCG